MEPTLNIKEFELPATLQGNIFAFGRIGCLDENTEIYVLENKVVKKKLSQLNDTFDVISFNISTKRKEIKKAIKINSGVKECYEIELENGSKVIASREHIFYNSNYEEIDVSNLKIGDSLMVEDYMGPIGMTKNNFPQFSRKGNKNYIGWNKGLTKDTDERIKKYSEKLKFRDYSYLIGDSNPSKTENVRRKLSIASSGKNNGMYGKKHTKEFKTLMSIRMKGDNNPSKRIEVRQKIKETLNKPEVKKKMIEASTGSNNPMYGKVVYPHMFFVKELNHKVRSNWEKEVCIILKENGLKYEYEPKAFKVNKKETYTPDIRLINNKFIEVKGPLFDNQIKKMQQFKEKYPKFKLILITGKRNFKKLEFADILIDYDYFVSRRSIDEIIKN